MVHDLGSDPETQALPPPNTYTVSHLIDHRPSFLTPPSLHPSTTNNATSDPAAFDYLTVWVGYEGEDTWEPRSSFWDEWKVSEYWSERRQNVADRNGWGKKQAEDEERKEKERVVRKWREYWADELKRQKRNGRRGAAGSGQKRKKREPAASNEPADDRVQESKEQASMETDGGQPQEEGVEVEAEQPTAKRQRTRTGKKPTRSSGGRYTRQTKATAPASEENDMEEVLDEERQQQVAQAASSTPHHTPDHFPNAAISPPQPSTNTRPLSPSARPPSPPPPPQTTLSTTRSDSTRVTPPPRLHSPPPAVPPPSPPPRRLSQSPTLAVTVPTPALAVPRASSSVVASDDDTIPASSQQDDDDLALTPIAMTVSSSISFDRQTSESDVDEVENDMSGRRRVRFNEHPVRIQLKVWEEEEEKEVTEAVERVKQRMQKEKEETAADSSTEPLVQPARRPLLSRKERDFIDRAVGKSVSPRPDDGRRASVRKVSEKNLKEVVEGLSKSQHNHDNDKHADGQQDAHVKTAVVAAPTEQTLQSAPTEVATKAVRVDENQQTDAGPAHSLESGVSVTPVIPPRQADNHGKDEDDQPIAQLIKKPHSLPTPEQQLAALSPSRAAKPKPVSDSAAHYDVDEDDVSEEEEVGDENQFTVQAIIDKRRRRGTTEYLIRWHGYAPEDDTWEPEDNVNGCDALLAAFEAKLSKQRGDRVRERKLRKQKDSGSEGQGEQHESGKVQKTQTTPNSSGAEVETEQQREESVGNKTVDSLLDDEKVDRQNGSGAKVEKEDAAVGMDEKKRTSLEMKRHRMVMEQQPPKNDVRSDDDSRTSTVRRQSSPPTPVKRSTDADSTSVERKAIADCSLDEIEYVARVKRREAQRLAIRERKERSRREMVAAAQSSSAARPVRASNGGADMSGRTAAPLKPGLLKRTHGSAVGGDRIVRRDERADGGEKGGVPSKINGVIPRIPKMSRAGLLSSGTSSPTKPSGASSVYTSPPPSRLRSPPPSPPMSPQSLSLSTSVLGKVSATVLVAQLGEINTALTNIPETQRSSSLPLSGPSVPASIHSPPAAAARSVSASDAPQPSPAHNANVLLMGDAALAFSLVLLDHRPVNPTVIASSLHPPSLTCASTPFLSLLSCHPKLYCVPAPSELTTLLPLSLTCGHLKGKRLYLRQDVDPLQLSESFPVVRFGCVQLSLGSEGENTAREVQLMEQLMCSVAQAMSSEGVLRWTVMAEPSSDTKRTEDSMRQRGVAAGLQLVSVERTYLGSVQPSTVADQGDAAHAKEDREKVRAELTTFMGGETYIFTRVPPPAQPAPPVVVEEEKPEEVGRKEILDRMRRERAEEQERDRQLRDLRARDKYATLLRQPSTEPAVQNSHSYHQAPLQLPNYVPRFDADKARYSAQAYLQHRLGGHGSMNMNGQGHGSAYVQ